MNNKMDAVQIALLTCQFLALLIAIGITGYQLGYRTGLKEGRGG